MTTLLHIASRVEAAVEAYISVKDFANEQEWREKFLLEMVSVHLHGNSIALHLNLENGLSFVSPLYSRKKGPSSLTPNFGGAVYRDKKK
jgi:hypothetical protein